MNTDRIDPLTLCALALLALVAPAPQAQAARASEPAAPALEQGGPALPASEDVIMLRLRDGSISWGAIADHDPDGIRFSMLSHGGLVRLPWQMIDPTQELELRTRFGYVDVSSEEYLIEVSRLVLRTGGEIVGEITAGKEGGDLFYVKVDGNTTAIPKARVARIESGVLVPALDIYGREEFYQKLLGKVDLDDLESRWELANDCERILDFAHAAQHYQAIVAADPEFRGEAPAAKLAAAQLKAEQQEQIDYLRDIDQLRKKKQYKKALEMCDAFGEIFRSSPLYEDANKKKQQVMLARDKALTEDVRTEWQRWMGRLAREAAIEKTYATAVDYASEQLAEDVVNRIVEVLSERGFEGIEAEQVRQYWSKRKKVRWTTASYGFGTWLLGKEDAQKGMKEDKTEQDEAGMSETQKQRASLEKKIARYLKSQDQARKARSRSDDADDLEAFWLTLSVNARAKWISAFYIENGGDFEVDKKPRLLACSVCGGAGAREIIYTGGGGTDNDAGSQLVRCPSCHGVQVVRQIRYR